MALILRDFFALSPSAGRSGGSSSDPKIRELAKSGKALKVTWRASQAGIVNGNNVMYSPVGMDRSSHTWVWPQKRPVQIHHDNKADPIGRVISGRYSDYSNDKLTDPQKDSVTVYRDFLERSNVVDAAKALEDSGVLFDKDWDGVGELIVEGLITDSDAIEKILDGRYLGVSITQHPIEAICSICGKDWAKGDFCDHERGEKDEETGRRMYLIIGISEYIELSYVNRPATKKAMGVDFKFIEGLSDSVNENEEKEILFDSLPKATVSFQIVDSLEDQNMKKNKKDTSDSNKKKLETSDSETEPETEDPPVEESQQEESKTSKVKSTIEEALKCLFEDSDNFTDELAEIINEELESLIQVNSEESDAKLSTKTRKSLPDSAFCGPNRSFPVPDCAHVTAAKRLLGGYKGPGSKEKISSCIARKEKALGCKSDSQDSKENESQEEFTLETLSDEELVSTLLDVEKNMIKRGLKADRSCKNCSEKDEQILTLESKLPDLEDTVKVLRSEYKIVLNDHTVSEDAHVKTLEELQQVLSDSVTKLLLIKERKSSEEDIKQKVQLMTTDELRKTFKDIEINEIISMLRSGLKQNTTEEITTEDAESKNPVISEDILKLSKSLTNFYRDHGSMYANQCLAVWQKAGKLPIDFTLDKAFEIVAE